MFQRTLTVSLLALALLGVCARADDAATPKATTGTDATSTKTEPAAPASQTTTGTPATTEAAPPSAYQSTLVPGEEDAKTRKLHISYTLGFMVGNDIQSKGFDLDMDRFTAGIKAALEQAKPELTQDQMQSAITAIQMHLARRQMEEEAKLKADALANETAGAAFLADNAAKEGVKVTASGLQYKVVKEGDGETPKPDSVVTLNYEGRLIDGKVFDSSYERQQPITWDPSQFSVIPGWKEAVRLMKPGAIFEVYIPAKLGYGDTGSGDIPPGSTLIFKMELLKVEPPSAATPEQVPTLTP